MNTIELKAQKTIAYKAQAKDHSCTQWHKESKAIIARLDMKIGGYADIAVSKHSIVAVGLALDKLKSRQDSFIYHLEKRNHGYYLVRYDAQIEFNLID